MVGPSTHGGTPGKGVDYAAHDLGFLPREARRYRRRVCGMSVDIRKAFDGIRRDTLWSRIRARLSDSKTIAWSERLYESPMETSQLAKRCRL